jgi:protein SCO1
MKLNTITYILFILALIFAGCSRENDSSHSGQMDMQQDDHSAHTGMEMKFGEPADESIYHATSSWRNRRDQEMNLEDLRGNVQVVAMVYTHCEYACPRILADMKRVQQELTGEARQRTNFVIISIDPERDTPERLSDFADENNLSDDSWILLNGSDGDVLELAALLGVRYKRISDTDCTHSNMISVLNREGEIIHQRKQLSNDQAGIIRAIEREFSL